MRRSSILRRVVVALILLAAVTVVAIVLVYVSTHGKITIVSEEGSEYEISNQAGERVAIGKLQGTTKSLTLPSGTYEVTLKKETANSFNTESVPRFLSNRTVEAKLKEEMGRQYIGEKPSSCLQMIGEILQSYECGGNLGAAKFHNPATPNYPPTASSFSKYKNLLIEGEFTVLGKTYVVAAGEIGDSLGYIHRLIEVTSGNDPFVKSTELKGSTSDATYKASPYKEGFILYDSANTAGLYYSASSFEAEPQKIEFPRTNESGLSSTLLIAHNDLLATYYSSDSQNVNGKTKPGKIIIGDLGSIAVEKPLIKMEFCGDNKFCLLDINKRLEVYAIEDGSLSLESTLSGVNDFTSNTDTIYISTNKGLLVLEDNLESGHFLYYSTVNRVGGLSLSGDSIVATIENSSGTSALLFSSALSDKSIDHKIRDLQAEPYVKTVSVYKNFIYLSVGLGELQYSQETGMFGYSPKIKAEVKQKLDAKTKELNLADYYVIAPLLQ